MCGIVFVLAVAILPAVGFPTETPRATVAEPESPAEVWSGSQGETCARFEKWAYGWLEVDVARTGAYEIVTCELFDRGKNAPAIVRGAGLMTLRTKGWFEHTGWTRIPVPQHGWWKPDSKNIPHLPPELEGSGTAPMKFVQVKAAPFAVDGKSLRRMTLRYPFDPKESYFHSSSPELDRVYEFCKYTILADTFLGVYIDGERERTPYEADSYITQLSNYAISSDYSLARKTIRFVRRHGTWPTEWAQHFIRLVHADWMYTGETNLVSEYWTALQSLYLKEAHLKESGFVETRRWNEKRGQYETPDIVDWPKCYRYDFDYTNANAVVNAFLYRNYREMAELGAAIGLDKQAAQYAQKADRFLDHYNRAMFDASRGLYVDGLGSQHSSLHANAISVALGLCEGERAASIAKWLKSLGMRCGTYFSQYLLEALFNAGAADAAIELMTSRGENSWLGMIEQGADATLETWRLTSEGGPDMSHAWSTAPLNVITRKLLGVTPLKPGFEEISVAPQLGSLKFVDARVPTKKGPLLLRIEVNRRVWKVRLTAPAPVRFSACGEVRSLPGGTSTFKIEEQTRFE